MSNLLKKIGNKNAISKGSKKIVLQYFKGNANIFGSFITGEDLAIVPTFLEELYEFLLKNGKKCKLIFQKSPQHNKVESIIQKINKTCKYDFENEYRILKEEDQGEEENLVYDSANVLLCYFRRMRHPLFPYEIYDELIRISKIIDFKKKKEELKICFEDNLSPPRFVLSRELFKFLNDFSQHSSSTGVTIKDFGKIFGPILIKPNEKKKTPRENENEINEIVALLIELYHFVFIEEIVIKKR